MDCFTVGTNANVQLSIVITTVKSIHLTVGGSKVAKTHIYCCSANFHGQNPVISVEILVIGRKRFTHTDFATIQVGKVTSVWVVLHTLLHYR